MHKQRTMRRVVTTDDGQLQFTVAAEFEAFRHCGGVAVAVLV